jgi:integrase
MVRMSEGTFYRRSDNGRWRVEFTDNQGRRRYRYRDAKGRTIEGRTHARQALREFLNRRDDGATGDDPTLKVWADWWLDQLDRRPTTIADYRYKVRLLPDWLMRRRLSTLTPMDVHEALREIAARPTTSGRRRASSSVAQVRSVLGNCLHAAERYGHVTKNAARLSAPVKVEATEIVPLDADQAKALLKVTDGHPLGTLYTLALGTGLRQGELLGLRWSAVDLEAGTLEVRSQITRTNTHELVEGAPKTARSRRKVRLPAFCVQALREHRGRRGTVVSLDGLVFATRTGRPYAPSNVRKHLTKACEQAGVPRVTFHTLRHSAATVLLDRGVPEAVIMDVLGHTDARMLSRYVHVTDSLRQQAADVMDGIHGH